MKLRILNEMPGVITKSMSTSNMANEHKKRMKTHFNSLLEKEGSWTKKVKGLTLKRIDNNYVYYDENGILYYGLQFLQYENGISIKWMENYSNILGLTNLIFTQIIKYDDITDVIYSGNSHTEDSIELHKNLKKFTQLDVVVWDDKKQKITNENPYSGIYSINKQFRFMLKENYDIRNFLEDESKVSIYLQENYERTKENIEHDLEYFISMYFVETDI